MEMRIDTSIVIAVLCADSLFKIFAFGRLSIKHFRNPNLTTTR